MAYQETTGSSPDDVINKIGTFADAAGWTVVENTLAGSNRTLVLQKGGDYVQLWNTDTINIFITGYIGHTPATDFSLQSGYAGNYAQANVGVGPYTNVFMFSDSSPADHVHVVIEMAGGVFRHLSFGMVDKVGAWTGGTYFDATYWTSSASEGIAWNSGSRVMFDYYPYAVGRHGGVRCDIAADGKTNAWALFRSDAAHRLRTGLLAATSFNGSGQGYLTTQFYHRNAAPFSGQVTLGSIRAEVLRTGGMYSTIGVFPNVRYTNMARFTPGQEITVGSDTWKVFPLCRKGVGAWFGSGHPDNRTPYSNDHAYAFKKVA